MRASSDDNSPSKDTQATGRSKTRRMLNVPLLVGTLIALVVLGPAAYCLHWYQARRVASSFLGQANGELSDWAVGVFRLDDKSPLAEAARQEADDARKEFPEWVAEEIRSGEEPALTDAAQELLAEWVLDLVLTDEKPALAAAARQEVDWVAAQGHLRRYLRLHPDDVDMQVRLAVAFDQSGKDPGHKWGVVKNHYYPVLGVVSGSKYAEKEPDLRRRLAELLIQIGRFASAESEAEKLLETNGKDPRARRLLAWALYGQAQTGALAGRPKGGMSVSEAFERAVALSPKDVQLAATLARIYRDKDKEELLSDEKRAISLDDRGPLADKVVDQVVTANPKSAEAFLARYLYRIQYKLDGAKDDLKSAREHGPKNLAVLLVAAEDAKREAKVAQQKAAEAHQRNAPADEISKCLAEAGKWLDEASGCYGDAIKVAPSNEIASAALGDVHQARGALHLAQAARYQAQGETQKAKDELKKAQGAVELAIEAWRRGVESGNRESILLNSRLAEVLIAAGRLDEAWIPSPDPNKPQERAKAERAPLHNLELGVRKLAQRLRRAERASLERSQDLIQAKWFIKKGRYIRRETPVNGYLEAIPRLRRVVVAQPGSPSEFSQAYQAWMLLGGAYAALTQWDQAAAAYEDAASLLPKAAQPHLAAAGAWATAGRPEIAIRHYEQALALGGLPPGGTAETWLALSRAQLQCQVRLPKQQRNWAAFDKALAEAKDPSRQEHLSSPWRLKVLEAEYVMVRAVEQGQRDEGLRQAAKLLREAEDEHSDSANLLQRLVLAYEQLGCPADADRALEKFDKLAGTSANACVLRSGLYSRRKQYEEAREALQEALTTLPSWMRPALQCDLAQISLNEGKPDQVRRELAALYKELAELRKEFAEPAKRNPAKGRELLQFADVGLLRRLVEMASQAAAPQELQWWEEELRGVEGPNGLWWPYYRAQRLLKESRQTLAGAGQKLAEARRTRDPQKIEEAERDAEVARSKAVALVNEASTLSNEIQSRRPAWALAYSLRGRLLERQARLERRVQKRQARLEKAAEAYERAIDLGAEQIAVYERLIPLLYQLQRSEEADRYLARLKSRGASSQNLLQYEISAAERQGGLAEAIEAADRAVKARPGDANARIWYGRLLLDNGQQEAAEAALKQAAELAPADAGPYGALLDFYVRTRQRERAEETLQEFGKKARLSGLQLALTGGDLYARLGDLRTAEAKYREAEKLAGDNIPLKVNIRLRLAAIFSRSDLGEVERMLREIVKLAPESDAARQRLVGLLAQRALASPGGQDEKVWQEIQQLLQQSSSGGKASSSSQRVQALLWLVRGGKSNLDRAERVFEKLIEDATGNVDPDRFSLAQVYAAQSEPYRADAERYEELKPDAEEYEKLKNDAEEYERLTSEQRKKLETDAPDRHKKLKNAFERRSELEPADKEYRGLVESHQQYTRLFGKSRGQFLAVVAREEPNPLYLELYVDLLLRHKQALPARLKGEATWYLKKLETIVTQPEPNTALLNRYFALLRRHNLEEEAGQSLTKLEEVLPDNLYVLALRVRWLHDGGRTSEVEPLVEPLAKKLLKALEKDGQVAPEKESQLCLTVGNVYTAVEQHQAAERWYRRLVELLPERYERLAMSFAQQGRHSEAIELCVEAAKSDSSPRPAVVLARVLTIGKPTDEDFERARPLLDTAAEDHKDNATVLSSIANVRIIEQQPDEAVRLYRQALKLRPKDAVSLNNLATVLAEQADTRKDALRYIEKAIRIGGPQPQYLDTKGTILILDGKPDEAVECLEKAVSAPRPDPRYHLHLAVAYLQLGEDEKARNAYKNALAGDLTSRILMPTDEKYLSELKQKLGQWPPSQSSQNSGTRST